MAVQKSKVSRSRRDMRRAHDSISAPALAIDVGTGETHLRHHITPNGYYKGREVLKKKPEAEQDSDEG